MKDKEYIKLTLKVFKLDQMDIDETTEYILSRYSSSKVFNSNSFLWGWAFGGLVSLISYFLTK